MIYILYFIIFVVFLFRLCMYCIVLYIYILFIFYRFMFKDMFMECFKMKSIFLNLKNLNLSVGLKEL